MFDKRKSQKLQHLVGGILDSQTSNIVVVRPSSCRVLYMNAAAKAHLPEENWDKAHCDRGYLGFFPSLCSRCPGGPGGGNALTVFPATFDILDENRRMFEVSVNKITWTDDKPALIFALRDVHEARSATARLYEMAYRDPLTGIPNRRRLKEDIEALEHEIAMGRLYGMVGIIDLDNFKAVNDTYGHHIGDFMLRALTDYLEGVPAFSGHLYRLGGDEFALLYSSPTRPEDPRLYYERLLGGALRAYSMPNIDLSCTLSMGAAFFPEHGHQYSELLRRADIALYEAKQNGRNRIAFFREELDGARSLRDIFVNIQPVLDSAGITFGYQLIDSSPPVEDEDGHMQLSEYNRTIDMLELDDLCSRACYFIAYTRQMLSSPPSGLRHKFIIEVSVDPDTGMGELSDVIKLRENGFRIALSGMRAVDITEPLLGLCDFIRIDMESNGEAERKLIAKNPHKVFIASGVNSYAHYEQAKARGYTLFQGFYFREGSPVTAKTKDIEPIRHNYYRLLQLSSAEGYMDFVEVSRVISSDLALSYRLLKLLNSAALALPNRISSISMAVAYLGEEHLKRWIALLGMRGIAPGKPLELVRISLVRARFAELLAPHFIPRRDPRHVFLVGLISLLGVAMDRPLAEVLEEMPLHEDISSSLLTKTGPHADLLAFFGHYECANWEEVSRFSEKTGLTSTLINEAYMAAVKWANSLVNT